MFTRQWRRQGARVALAPLIGRDYFIIMLYLKKYISYKNPNQKGRKKSSTGSATATYVTILYYTQ